MTIALTSLARGAGCGCKLPAAAVHPLVAGLPAPTDPRVLVATGTADDAGVVRVRDDLALVQTVDFFTPIVDDPYWFGRIAAANALSDVYAMGGEPLSALNLVAFPLEDLGAEVLRAILRGGHDAVAQAGASIVGGHSIDDPEPKYGLAVTGTVHPDEVLTNAGGRPGDALVLTKPLGVGAITTAIKRGRLGDGAAGDDVNRDDLLSAATQTMAALNADAAHAARAAGATALTDVTGFGLVGHLHELCAASGCAASVAGSSVPALEGALALLEGDEGVAVSGGSKRNRAYAEERFTEFAASVPEAVRRLVCDATTSGGLLAAIPPSGDTSFGTVVGELVAGPAGTIAVR